MLPALLLAALPAARAAVLAVEYAEDADAAPANPERGFYTPFDYHASDPAPLGADDTAAVAAAGQSLLMRHYVLDAFVDADLSDAFLADVDADMAALRAGGLKTVLRFSYTTDLVEGGPYGDASEARMLAHIAQLEPHLAAAEDVLAVVQTGFVGTWGEWYYSDLDAALGDYNWDARGAVFEALLAAVPASRRVQLRTPLFKYTLLNQTTDEPTTAASPEAARRTGHHNDCWLASDSDYGTYVDVDAEYPYLEADAAATSMGGETCNPNTPRSDCATALAEAELFSWTYLNSAYHQDVLQSWVDGGCMDEMERRLGYRFVLRDGEFADRAAPGGGWAGELDVDNEGFADPMNARAAHVVWRHLASGALCAADLPATWELGDLALPADMPAGDYELLADSSDPLLPGDPAYKIAVANLDVAQGEAGTGFVKLLHTVRVFAGASDEPAAADAAQLDCSAAAAAALLPAAEADPLGYAYVQAPGFEEEDDDSWTAYSGGFTRTDAEARSGSYSARVDGDGAARQSVAALDAPAGAVLGVAGWSKAVGAVGADLGSDYSLYVDVADASGAILTTLVAEFAGGAHDWARASANVTLAADAASALVYAMYRNDADSGGQAYFDDVELLVDGEAPLQCASGYYYDSASSSVCAWCPAGFACASGAPVACAAGTFSGGGLDECVDCLATCDGECSAVAGVCECGDDWIGVDCSVAFSTTSTDDDDDSTSAAVNAALPAAASLAAVLGAAAAVL